MFVDFVNDEPQGFSKVRIVCFLGGVGGGIGTREEKGVGGGAGLEERHLFEGVEGEEMLVAVGVQDEAFEGVEVFGPQAA